MKLFKNRRKRLDTLQVPTRRRLHVSHLEIGMYVCELDRPWRQTDFLFQGFPLLKIEHIHAVRERCDYVFVDDTRKVRLDQGELLVPSAAPGRVQRNLPRIPLSLEVEEARRAYRAGSLVIDQVLLDVQQGRPIDTRSCQVLVKRNLESLLRNESAMLWLTRLKAQDRYTGLHCLSVSILAMGFGVHLGLSDEKVETLGIAGLLHDVGKMKIDPRILNKPGKLTPEEFEQIKLHPAFGFQALQNQPGIPPAAVQAAHAHHERLDSRGYPLGLDRYQIPFITRIITIVDAFDAITSHRSYDDARPIQVAYDVLRSGGDKQFWCTNSSAGWEFSPSVRSSNCTPVKWRWCWRNTRNCTCDRKWWCCAMRTSSLARRAISIWRSSLWMPRAWRIGSARDCPTALTGYTWPIPNCSRSCIRSCSPPWSRSANRRSTDTESVIAAV